MTKTHNLHTSIHSLKEAKSLEALYPALDQNQMTAGWHKKRPSLWPEPHTDYKAAHWSYEVGKTALDRAGLWMDTEMAERRNLLLFNRISDNDYDTVRSLVAAYQMVMPGEHARAHRHSPNALRIVLDAPEECFTVVDGIKLAMRPGDLLLTPSNAWHSHFNHGQQNAYWIDVLDVPLVHRLEPMFVEHLPGGVQKIQAQPNIHPFSIPLSSIMSDFSQIKNINGYKKLSINTGEILKTITINYHEFSSKNLQFFKKDTVNRIFAVLKGNGKICISENNFNFSFGDVIGIPIWKDYTIITEDESILIEISDQRTMQILGFYRQESTSSLI